MKRKYILAILIIALVLLVLPSAFSETVGTAECHSIRIFIYTGYTCQEESGSWRSFYNPGAYEKMHDYYVPPNQEEYIPPSIFIYGAPTENI